MSFQPGGIVGEETPAMCPVDSTRLSICGAGRYLYVCPNCSRQFDAYGNWFQFPQPTAFVIPTDPPDWQNQPEPEWRGEHQEQEIDPIVEE
jgi:hypothetical protein